MRAIICKTIYNTFYTLWNQEKAFEKKIFYKKYEKIPIKMINLSNLDKKWRK